MTETNLLLLASSMPSIVKLELAKGHTVSYRSNEYPGLLLLEYPNGRLESIDVDLQTGETIVLKTLRENQVA